MPHGRGPSIRSRLARRFDPDELRAIKKLWVRHSIAEDARDIDGLIATLAPDCVYEIVPTGQRWEGHAGARAFYTELFARVPGQPVRADRHRRRAAGRVRGGRADRHPPRPWAGVPASRTAGQPGGADPVPVGPRHAAVPGRADLVRPRHDRGCLTLRALEDRPDLGREAGHRLLVVRAREAGDEVAVADLEERRAAARRRPPACRPAGPSRGSAWPLRSNIASWTRSASSRESRMTTVPSPSSARSRPGRGRPSRSAGGGSLPCAGRSRARRRRCSRRAYRATSLSVTCSPPPPIRIGRCSWIGGGSLRTSRRRVARAARASAARRGACRA